MGGYQSGSTHTRRIRAHCSTLPVAGHHHHAEDLSTGTINTVRVNKVSHIRAGCRRHEIRQRLPSGIGVQRRPILHDVSFVIRAGPRQNNVGTMDLKRESFNGEDGRGGDEQYGECGDYPLAGLFHRRSVSCGFPRANSCG